MTRSRPASSRAWRDQAGLPRVSLALEFGTSRQVAGAAQADSAPALRAWRSFDPANIGGVGQLGAIQGAAASLGVEVSPVDLRDVRRDRARHHRLRARAEWRPDRGGERIGRSFIAR